MLRWLSVAVVVKSQNLFEPLNSSDDLSGGDALSGAGWSDGYRVMALDLEDRQDDRKQSGGTEGCDGCHLKGE